MAGATFGRKGTGAVAAPGGRRAQFIAPAGPKPEDEMAQRREAFLAAERARAGETAEARPVESAARAATSMPVFVKQKSLGTAYVLWFFLGGISAHRFYLNNPLSAIAQTCMWYVSLMFWMAGHDGAFYPMTAGLVWLFADPFLIPGMHRAINEKLQAQAEARAWEKDKAPEA